MRWPDVIVRVGIEVLQMGYMKKSRKNGGKNMIQNQSNMSAVSKSTLGPQIRDYH